MLHVSRKGTYNDISWKWGMIVAHVRCNRFVVCGIYNKLYALDAFKQMRWHSYVPCDGPSVFQCNFSPIGNVCSLKYRIFMRHDLWGTNNSYK